jgi:hypothetical protein
LEELLELTTQLGPLTTYLVGAQANLPGEHPWAERAAAVRQGVIEDVRRAAKGEAARTASELQRELEELKREYIAAYAAQHKRQTLGPDADDKRVRLRDSDRLRALRALAKIDNLPSQKLDAIQQGLIGLKTCRDFHEGVIADTPTCPICHLNPSQQATAAPADERLAALDRAVDTLLREWQAFLRQELAGEGVRRSLEAMEPQERAPIEAFFAQGNGATDIPEGLAKAVNAALRGIETLTLCDADISDALQRGGMPATRQQIEQRFKEYLDERMRGKDTRATRLVLVERQDARG